MKNVCGPIYFSVMISLVCLVCLAAVGCGATAEPPASHGPAGASDREFAARREGLGRQEKFRIMVDKVLVVEAPGHRMTEEHVRTFAKAGFNVVIPRSGAGDIRYVRKMARLARKHGVFYMPWMGHMTPPGRAGENDKIVWADGVVQDRHSPNSEKLWTWLTQRIVAYAKISAAEPALIGVFLDFENYGWPKAKAGRWLYELSYDAAILAEFAKARPVEIPSLKPKRRAAWLKEHNLHEAFKNFQIDRWRRRCRELRRQVDAINPKFQFCFYPNAHYSLFMREAAMREWSTKEAPVIVADYHNYFRQDGRHKQAMARARWLILDAARWVKNHAGRRGVEAMVIGGIDPVLDPAQDPEFHGRNAAVIADHSSGYWVFYEFKRMRDKAGRPMIPPVNAEFLKWWTRANRAIAAGRAGRFWRGERETPEVVGPMILTDMEGPGVITVTLEGPRKDAEVRYTLDGTDPAGDSPRYAGPVRVTKITKISAAVFRASKPDGAVSRRTIGVPLEIIEAESASLAEPWVVRTDGNDGKRKYIVAPRGRPIDLSDPDCGALEYRFEVPKAGKYALAFLVRGPWGIENSFYVKVDGGRFKDWYAMSPRREGWYWRRFPADYDLKRGRHSVVIRPRAAGATLDKLAVIKVK